MEISCLHLIRPGFEPGHLMNRLSSRLNSHSNPWATDDKTNNLTTCPHFEPFIHSYIHTMHACTHPSYHPSIHKHTYIHTYILAYMHTCIHAYIYNTYIHTYLLLILMLWHRQAIFESKGDKLSSSAEGRIRTQRVSDTHSPADWMLADKPTELSRIKLKKLELDSPSPWSASIQPNWPHCNLAFAPGSGDIHICCC